MNDYSLLVLAKSGDKQAEYTLFNNYKLLVRKKHSKIASYLNIEFEDFLNDSYFRFLTAVKEVREDRITDKENWKFYASFNWTLNDLITYYVDKKRRSVPIATDFKDEYGEEASDLDYIIDKYGEVSTDPTYKEVSQNLLSDSFIKSMNKFEKDLFSLYKTAQELKEDLTITKAAKDLGMCTARAYKELVKSKKRFNKLKHTNYEE